MKMPKRVLAMLLALVLVVGILPFTASAEAGDWDPLIPFDQVAGDYVGEGEPGTGSAKFEAGRMGYLKAMPTLDTYYYSYNAMAYASSKATSTNPDIVEVRGIQIGKWQGGAWNGADCLQANVMPKKAGTATVIMDFYYTFSQSANPITNPNAQWLHGTMTYTVTVTGTVEPDVTYTLSYNANGGENAPAAQTATNNTGSATFTVTSEKPTWDGYTFLGWADTPDAATAGYLGGDTITLYKDAPSKTLYAVWEKIPAPEYTYTLTYAPNGESVTDMPEDESETSTAESYNFTVADKTPKREGYTFLGWADADDALTAGYLAGATITLYKDAPSKTIFAVWQKNADPDPGVKDSEPGMKKTADVTSLGRGQEVNFTLTSNVPDYLGDYLNLPVVPDPEIVTTNAETERGSYVLNIHDLMDAGLTYKDNTLAVTVNGVTLTEAQYTKTITKNENGTTTFLISMDLVKLCEQKVFTEQDIEKAPEIKVTYTATLDPTAGAGKYNNEAWTSYPTPIQTRAADGEKESTHSTVTLDVYGIRVFKYDQNGNTPLEGAEFQLLSADGSTVLVESVLSGKDGYLMFDGLAAGTYQVKEIQAPAGYVKSDKALVVVLPEKADLVTNISDSQFANARIPHTGGEGTTQFLILGGALMGMAIALYMASRKKRSFQA